jgi:hypothetical protein
MVEETLRLEGFSDSLRGARSYCVAASPAFAQRFLKSRLAALDADVAHRGRKILVFQGAAPAPRWLLQHGWDATFHVRDVADLKLALTHLQHAARPTRVVWAGGDPAPAALATLARMEGISLLSMGEKPPAAVEHWQAIFWSPDAAQEDVEAALVARMGTTGVTGLRSVLKELRGSQVGLVWSSIGESDKKGSIYWYDPSEGGETAVQIDLVEAAAVLTDVAALLLKK